MSRYEIATIPGDGIGLEVTPAATAVLDAAGATHGFELSYTEHPWGCDFYAEHGRMAPEDYLDTLGRSDAILLGAVGRPDVPDHVSLWGLLIPIRRHFRQYVNLRPVRLFEGVPSPLRDATIDMVIVRENNEGEYSEIGGRLHRGTEQEIAVQESLFTRIGTDRVIAYAFAQAEGRSKRICSATKSNGIIHTMPFWDERFALAREQHPDVAAEQVLIDALAAALILDPGALRRDRRLQPVRRHPLRPRGRGGGEHRHRAVGQPQPGARAAVDVRARPRLGARHRRQGRRQPGRRRVVGGDDARPPRRAGGGRRDHARDRAPRSPIRAPGPPTSAAPRRPPR